MNEQAIKNPGCANNLGFKGTMNINQFQRHQRSEQIILEKVLTMRTSSKFKAKIKQLLNEIKGPI
jgi:hypothetical protein